MEATVTKLIKSCEFALEQLDIIINQKIDLKELDPEKAKIAAQGKVEAIEGSIKIINKIKELKGDEQNTGESQKKARVLAGGGK